MLSLRSALRQAARAARSGEVRCRCVASDPNGLCVAPAG